VVERAFQGATTLLTVAVEGQVDAVAVELPLEAPDALPVGASLRLSVRAARAVLVEVDA
jgi:hypothetical protein